jgi:hypothetical protein
LVEHRRRQCHDLAVGQAVLAKIFPDLFSQTGKDATERLQAVELGFVPNLLPIRVIDVLLASGRISSGGLQMAAFVLADPNVGPGRGDDEG